MSLNLPTLLGVVAVLGVLWLIFGRKPKSKATDASPRGGSSGGDLAFLDRRRELLADAQREVGKVKAVIEALRVVEPPAGGGASVSRAELSGSLWDFLGSKTMLGWETSTQMVHVVMSPRNTKVFARLKPTRPEAAMRVFTRTGEDDWTVETRHVVDMQAAIAEADREAHAV